MRIGVKVEGAPLFFYPIVDMIEPGSLMATTAISKVKPTLLAALRTRRNAGRDHAQ
jgi:hypothetical protein